MLMQNIMSGIRYQSLDGTANTHFISSLSIFFFLFVSWGCSFMFQFNQEKRQKKLIPEIRQSDILLLVHVVAIEFFSIGRLKKMFRIKMM